MTLEIYSETHDKAIPIDEAFLLMTDEWLDAHLCEQTAIDWRDCCAHLMHQLTQARERLAKIVECEGENAGRFVLNPLARLYVTEDGETRMRMSYAGNALVELYEGLK